MKKYILVPAIAVLTSKKKFNPQQSFGNDYHIIDLGVGHGVLTPHALFISNHSCNCF